MLPPNDVIEITRGEKVVFTIRLRDKEDDPIDLNSFDEFKVCIRLETGVLEITEVANANGSKVEILGNALLGKLQVTIFSADTLLLRIGARQNIDIEIDNSVTPNPKRKRFLDKLIVIDSACS